MKTGETYTGTTIRLYNQWYKKCPTRHYTFIHNHIHVLFKSQTCNQSTTMYEISNLPRKRTKNNYIILQLQKTRFLHTYKIDAVRFLNKQLLDLTVQHKHDGRADGTKSVGSGTLEKGGSALLLDDLGKAIGSALVDPLVLGLLGLHLQASADGIERVGSITGSDGGDLGNGKLGGKAKEVLLLSERVDAGDGVEHTEVHTTVRDDAHNGHTETVVQTHHTGRTLGSLHQAISKAVEGLLGATNIGGKSGTGIVKRVDNAQGTSAGKTTGSHVGHEEPEELLLGVVSGEQVLEGILEGKVERLGREVADHVGEVTSPEGSHTLLLVDTGEAVNNTSVSLDGTILDQRVGILGLDDQLHSLNRSSGGLGNSTRHTTGGEISSETLPKAGRCLLFLLLFCHFKNRL
jgi:hypothetical protein